MCDMRRPEVRRHSNIILPGVRGLAAGVLRQALEETVMHLKYGVISDPAHFLFDPDRAYDRAIWLALAGLEEGQFQSLCWKAVRRASVPQTAPVNVAPVMRRSQ